MSPRLLPLLALPLLSACIVPIPVPEGTPGAFELVLDEGDPCGARQLGRSYVGQDAAVVRGTVLVLPDGSPLTVRIIAPGDAVTEDFSPTRANFRTDAAGIVTAVECG